MKYLYYPGCSLTASAREYDLATRAVMSAAGVTLTEIVVMPGGEACKLSKTQIMEGIRPIERNGIDRHSSRRRDSR